jgi:hypothetical protein
LFLPSRVTPSAVNTTALYGIFTNKQRQIYVNEIQQKQTVLGPVGSPRSTPKSELFSNNATPI